MANDDFIVRFSLVDTDDTDKIQRIKGQGRADELFGLQRPILRHQPAGLSSRPSEGVGVVFCLGGNADQAIAIALENQNKRPTGLEKGETIVYNEFAAFIKFDKDGNIIVTPGGSGKIYLGGTAGALGVKLADGSTSTKVFAQP